MHPLHRTGIRNAPEKAFYIFNQQIYFIIFFRLAEQFQFIPLQNVAYFTTLPFLDCKIFIVDLKDVLNFKSQAPGPRG